MPALHRIARTTLITAVLLAPACVTAQNIPRNFVSDVKYGFLDILSVWASPFRGSLHGYVAGGAALAGAGLISLGDADIAQWIRDHPDAAPLRVLTPFRDASGTGIVNIGAGNWHTQGALAVYGVGLLAGSRTVREIGMGCLSAAEAHSALRQIVYQSVSRERPLFRETIDGEEVERAGRPYHIEFPGKDTWFDNSFFAGHVATVTSCISFITHRFHLGYGAAALWALGAGVSLGRMADQHHYASDVAIGGVIGFGVGKVIGERMRKRDLKRDAARAGAAAAPTDTATAAGHDLARSWMDGLYLSQSGPTTFVGWRTKR